MSLGKCRLGKRHGTKLLNEIGEFAQRDSPNAAPAQMTCLYNVVLPLIPIGAI
jgi:hypothetical protein